MKQVGFKTLIFFSVYNFSHRQNMGLFTRFRGHRLYCSGVECEKHVGHLRTTWPSDKPSLFR